MKILEFGTPPSDIIYGMQASGDKLFVNKS